MKSTNRLPRAQFSVYQLINTATYFVRFDRIREIV